MNEEINRVFIDIHSAEQQTLYMPNAGPEAVIYFDGVCNFCNGSVRFIFDRDPSGRFRFASLQSEAAGQRLSSLGIDASGLSSIIVVQGQHVYEKSQAVLLIASGLGPGWALLARFARLIPRAARDHLYTWFAHHRYQWFGKSEHCALPKPGLRERFIDTPPP